MSGPIEMKIDANRCNFEMTQCEKYPGFTFNSMCQRIKQTRTLFHDVWVTLKPALVCPLTPQKYETKNASVDLSMLEPMPISGYAWLVTIKLINGEGKKRETVLCILFEFKIVRAKTRQGN